MTSTAKSVYACVAGQSRTLTDQALAGKLYMQHVVPLLPIMKSSTINTQISPSSRTIHSLRMTAPNVLNVSNWATVVLRSYNSFRVSFKYNGVRVWLVTSCQTKGIDEDIDKTLEPLSLKLALDKYSITMLLDRSGNMWLLDSANFYGSSTRLWLYPCLIEGEICSTATNRQSTLVLFDLICIGGQPWVTAKENMDSRILGVQKIASAIKCNNFSIVAKQWWDLSNFKSMSGVGSEIGLLEDQIYACVEDATDLPIDGLILAHVDLVAMDSSKSKRLNAGKLFKYKINHTIDLLVGDLGFSADLRNRNIVALPVDHVAATNLRNRTLMLSDSNCPNASYLSKHISEHVSIASEYDPDAITQLQYSASSVNCVLSYSYYVQTSHERAFMASLGITTHQVEVKLCIQSDHLKDNCDTSNNIVSDMRNWLMMWSPNSFNEERLMTSPKIVEFSVALVSNTSESLLFNLTPITLRLDKPMANSSQVVAETCVASLYEKFKQTDMIDENILSIKMMHSALNALP